MSVFLVDRANVRWKDGEDGSERIVWVGKDGLSCLDTGNFNCFELFKSHSAGISISQ